MMNPTTAAPPSYSKSANAEQEWSLEVVRPKLKNTLHSNGHTSLEYDNQSSQIISCNHTDNEIYLFQVDHMESLDLTSSDHRKVLGEDSSRNVTFVKISGNNKHAVVGLNNFRVELYTYPEFEKDGLLVRFESAPTCAKMNCDNSFVAIGSQDGSLKVVEMESPHRFKLFEGHTGPILDVEYDPSEDYLVSSSCDGTVKVWNSGNRKCLKTFICVPTSNDLDNSKTMAKCAWQPKIGNYLAVPADKCVKFYDRRLSNFLEGPKFVYKLESLIHDFVSMVCWHPGTNAEERSLIAMVTVSTDVILTELVISSNQIVTLRCILGKQNKVTSFLWIPNSTNFVIADDIGMLYFYSGCVPSANVEKKDLESSVVANTSGKLLVNETVKGADEILNEMAIGPRQDKTAFDGDDDVEDGSISLDQIKQSYVMQVEKGPTDHMDGGNLDSQGMPIDGGVPAAIGDGSGGELSRIPHITAGPAAEVISYQVPFQPSCSPVNLSSRYMKWNLVGIVRRDEGVQDENLTEDDQTASITVEFHDTTFHHSMHLKDEHGYTLADLSEEALLLAAPSSLTSASKQSVITCNTFSFWDHSNQWSAELPLGEKAVAVCIGSQSWLAVATSQSLLRIFSVSGIQLSVVMLSGHLVSIAAGSDELLHVFQPSQTLQKDRFYSSSIYKVTGFEANLTLTEQFPLCEADDGVTWVGFSQEGDPVVSFLNGPLYMLKRSSSSKPGATGGHCWMPVFNCKQHLSSKSDRIWIVGLAGKQLRAIYCKASRFPAQLPKPIVLTYPLGLPLCNVDSEQSQIEMQLQNQRLFSILSNQEVQSAFLKLFALACRTDRDCRAVDICNLMPNEETVILAIKYATKLKKLTLAQKLSVIAHEKSSAVGNSESESIGVNVDDGVARRVGVGEFGMQDENSRSLFNSQHNSQSQTPFSLDSGGGGADVQDEINMDATNSDSVLVSNNPILRRANSKLRLSRNSSSNDLSGGDTTDMSGEGQEMPKRRVNPFLQDNSSTRLNSYSSTTADSLSRTLGSSVFDSMQFLKPDKIRSKSSSSDLKSLSKRKYNSIHNQEKSTSSKSGFGEDSKDRVQLRDASGKVNDEVENAATKMTPFQAYFQQVKPGLQEADVNKSSEELLSVAMKRWKKMSADEKAQFASGEARGDFGTGNTKRKSSIVDREETNNDADGGQEEAPKKSKFDSSSLLQQFSFS